mmetsp:Transcript_9928/g.15342  ORF Transcript_9928/g.15342 Transcript_9928/m.15342 type:complete len:252 (-) Transcript_9928:93-848(-)|eukprot:CAMPEP_0118673124 /NCGR_PEP_ID=MMETSP0800-20121206/143_1 /TAXON_ID=210618 ORGANISM="Striatella unipunctata, Strain CCMP2910" /NCGR_SAMPLE_ID=MMETSP0800 /ASSEMBLY_ACC=CAM_ASM_000638 /LENGTH=251 /DNA_ID=CAMNT_0006568143 /DNA_START=37 /DNA_END=792 /DNA_ORIENTATION=-
METPKKTAQSPGSKASSEEERAKALRDYKVTIEYKHLKQHAPGGVYLLPSWDSIRHFHGVIFVRRGLFTNGIFKFQIHLPDSYNDVNAHPKIVFSSHVYNPHVHPTTGELDIVTAYPHWDPQHHFLVTVLTYLKKIFYVKDASTAVANPEARELSRTNPEEYRKKVEACVRESQKSVFVNDPGCTTKFTEDSLKYQKLRKELREIDVEQVTRKVIMGMIDEIEKSTPSSRNSTPRKGTPRKPSSSARKAKK